MIHIDINDHLKSTETFRSLTHKFFKILFRYLSSKPFTLPHQTKGGLDLSLHTGPPEGLDQYGCCKEGLNGANDQRGITAESLAKYRTGVWSKNTGGEFCPTARELSSFKARLLCGYQACILNMQ